jgi:N-hydroxyarylamine O-acetyltransferase
MDVNAYLARIGLSRPPKPDLESLKLLHRSHLLAIPFENFDVQMGRRIAIDPPSVYRKIVERKRGGWCYEMNGLFGWALGEMGFRVTRATGAVGRETSGASAVGNHLILKVELDEGVYLADVGFGDGPIEPTRITPGDFSMHGFRYGLARADGAWWRLRNNPRGGAPSFDFLLTPADESALAAKCDWLQSAAESPFVQNAVCQRYVPDGLIALRGRTLKRIASEHITNHLIASADEYISILAQDFALDLPEAAALWPKICARHEALFAAPPAT